MSDLDILVAGLALYGVGSLIMVLLLERREGNVMPMAPVPKAAAGINRGASVTINSPAPPPVARAMPPSPAPSAGVGGSAPAPRPMPAPAPAPPVMPVGGQGTIRQDGPNKPGGMGPSFAPAPAKAATPMGMGGARMFAQGGPVIGKESSFMKTPDRFRGAQTDPNTFGKGGGGQASGKPNPSGANKMAGHGPNCSCPKCKGK